MVHDDDTTFQAYVNAGMARPNGPGVRDKRKRFGGRVVYNPTIKSTKLRARVLRYFIERINS